jgi:large subunit ribosomal protein L24
MARLKIKKGDQVIVTTGKDKGKKGEVLKVLTEKNRVIVSGVNVVKKHERASQTSAGGIVEKELSINISNVAVVDPKEGVATRVGFKILENGEKVRVSKKSGEVIA